MAAAFVSFFVLSNMAGAKSKQNDSESITISPQTMNLYEGQTRTLSAGIGRSGKTTDGVIWKSSDKKVAKVDKKGKVKAVRKGKTVISAISKSNKKNKAKCRIKVKKFKEKSFVVNRGEGVFFTPDFKEANDSISFSVLKIHNKKELDKFLDRQVEYDELKEIRSRYKKSFFEKDGLIVYTAYLREYSHVSSVGFEYNIIQNDDGKINLSVDISETRPEVPPGIYIIDDFYSKIVCVPVSNGYIDYIDCITVCGEVGTDVLEAGT